MLPLEVAVQDWSMETASGLLAVDGNNRTPNIRPLDLAPSSGWTRGRSLFPIGDPRDQEADLILARALRTRDRALITAPNRTASQAIDLYRDS